MTGSWRAAFSHSASVGSRAARPRGVGVGLVRAHVHDRLVERHRLDHTEPPPPPRAVRVAGPERGRDEPGLGAVAPARLRPPAGIAVAVRVDERGVLPAGDRSGGDPERGHVDDVRGPLVVQRPRLGGRAHPERPRGHQRGARGQRPARRWRRRGEHRRTRPQLVGGEHRLVVLLLVLHDHAEREAVGGEPAAVPQTQRGAAAQHVQRLLAHLGDVRARLAGREQRQLDPARPGVLEGVVEAVDLGAQRRAAADVAHQPQLFLAADVREVPDQRRHQRRVLRDEIGLVDGVGERGAAGPRRGEEVGDAGAQRLGGGRGVGRHSEAPSGSSAGHRPCRTSRSVMASSSSMSHAGAPRSGRRAVASSNTSTAAGRARGRTARGGPRRPSGCAPGRRRCARRRSRPRRTGAP